MNLRAQPWTGIAATTALLAAALALDLSGALGSAGGVAYVPPFLCALLLRRNDFLLGVAVITSALTLVGLGLSPPEVSLETALANRALSLMAIWSVTAAAVLWRQAEDRRLESESRFVEVADEAPIIIWMSDTEKRTSYLNRRWPDFTGRRMEQEVGYGYLEAIHPDDRDRVWKLINESMDTREPFEFEFRLRHREHGYRWVLNRGTPRFTDEGTYIGYVGTCTDIDDRVRAEEQLALRSRAVHAATDGIMVCDAAGDMPILYVNEAFTRLTGYTSDEVVGRNARFLQGEEHDQPGLVDLREALAQGREARAVLRNFRKDGTPFWNELFVTPQRDPNGVLRYYAGALKDITERVETEQERRRFEERLFQTQKLESLGVIAGGIAHDFNNLLAGILGNADLALADEELPDELRDMIEQIAAAGGRASELVAQLMAYAGKATFERETTDLSDLVREMTSLLRTGASTAVTVRQELCPVPVWVDVDATQVRQVVMNLVTNAAEAVGEREGSVSIRTGVMNADRSYLTECYLVDDLAPGPYAYVEVADDGVGMDDVTFKRIFEPFFTTKFAGRGLGLASVLGIVRGHGGTLRVTSETGVGTRFRVLLPLAASPRLAREDGGRTDRFQGRGVCLVIDDEDVVRKVSARLLESIGFSVRQADSGREGVALARREGDRLRLVLLDLTMPGMDGEATFEAIRALRPDLPVLFMTGHGRAEAAQRIGSESGTGLLQKPFNRQRLSRALAELLGDT